VRRDSFGSRLTGSDGQVGVEDQRRKGSRRKALAHGKEYLAMTAFRPNPAVIGILDSEGVKWGRKENGSGKRRIYFLNEKRSRGLSMGERIRPVGESGHDLQNMV